MDLRVDDQKIVPLRYRIRCDLMAAMPNPMLPPPWPTDERGFLAYSDAERDEIAAALANAKVAYTIDAIPQPDPTLLAACQGKVRSRSEALAALAAGKPPVTLEAIAADVEELKARPASEPIQELPS
jgi:hypothetical protein